MSSVVGADTWPVEAAPGEHADRPFELKVATGAPGNSVAIGGLG